VRRGVCLSRNDAFITKKILCPACGKHAELRYPDPKFYSAVKRESDLHVTAYRWSQTDLEAIQPQHYAVWQCPSCLFADFSERLEAPEGSFKEEYLLDAFKAITDEKRMILEELRQIVSKGEINHQGAVALHLSALLIAGLPEKERIDHHKLGRLALRLAWLFRERCGGTDANQPGSGTLAELHDGAASIENRIASLGEAVNKAKAAANGRSAELGIPSEGGENPYSPVLASFSDKLEEMSILLIMFQSAVAQDDRGDFKPQQRLSDGPSADLGAFLTTIKRLWPDIPLREGLCLRLAVDAFEYCYNNETTFQSIEKSMVILGLIIEMLMRLNQYERALGFIAEVYKSGLSNKQELQRRIGDSRRSRNLRTHDEQMLYRKIATINMAIRQAGKNRKRIIEVLLEKHNQTIEKVLDNYKGQPAHIAARALIKAGIPDAVVQELKARETFK
jgi:hypothetical protein